MDLTKPKQISDLPMGVGGGMMPPGSSAADDDEEVFHLGEVIATLLEYKWLIICVTALALAAGILVTFITTPIYKGDALLQVEEKSKGLSALTELQPLLDDATSVSAELEILQSRMILGRVVDRLAKNHEIGRAHV